MSEERPQSISLEDVAGKRDSGPPVTSSTTEMPASGIPLEDQQRISQLYEKLNRTDHYTLLGVSATDDAKAIKRAYFALAKTHHPDRWFRKEVGSLRGKIDAIFAAMTTALETLSNHETRAEYDSYLREVLKTRMSRRQAIALEAKQEWLLAAEAWAKAVERLPTDPYVQHRYAYTLLRARTGYEVAIEAATRAIELDPTRAEYRITCASLNLAAGYDRNALAQLEVACELESDRADLAALHAGIAERVSRTR